MSLITNSPNTRIQLIFADELNPAYETFLQATEANAVLDAASKIRGILENIRSINPQEDLVQVERKIEQHVTRVCSEATFSAFQPSQDPHAPRGIANAGANCWANTLIHLLTGSSEILKKILSSKDPLVTPIAGILRDFQANKAIDSQAFRLCIHNLATKEVDKISALASNQIDVFHAYQLICAILDFGIEFQRERVSYVQGSTFSSSMPDEKSSEIVMMLQSSPTFDGMVRNFLEDPLDGGQEEHVVKVLLGAPDDLVVQAKRFGLDMYGREVKFHAAIQDVPLLYAFPQASNPIQGSSVYRFASCIIHTGMTPKNGHYVMLERRGKTFYFINDESVFRWEENQWTLVEGHREKHPSNLASTLAQTPEGMATQGYLFHYTKVQNNRAITLAKQMSLPNNHMNLTTIRKRVKKPSRPKKQPSVEPTSERSSPLQNRVNVEPMNPLMRVMAFLFSFFAFFFTASKRTT